MCLVQLGHATALRLREVCWGPSPEGMEQRSLPWATEDDLLTPAARLGAHTGLESSAWGFRPSPSLTPRGCGWYHSPLLCRELDLAATATHGPAASLSLDPKARTCVLGGQGP